MKKQILFFGSVILFFVPQILAQTTPSSQINSAPAQISKVDPKDADVAITANVTARELKFEIVPNPTVEFPGKPERNTAWEADRQNLPKPVEPGVTYRNIGIQLRIASRFADIDRIVAEALGEIPIANENPPEPENKPASQIEKPINQSKQIAKSPRRNTVARRKIQ